LEQILTRFFEVLKLVWSFSLFTHWRCWWVGDFESRLLTVHTTEAIWGPLKVE